MKIAIAGKGGSGKTTIAGILTRLLAERGQEVWAIDADSNPNFGVTLGLPLETVKQRKAMPFSILKEITGADGKATMQLAVPARRREATVNFKAEYFINARYALESGPSSRAIFMSFTEGNGTERFPKLLSTKKRRKP